MTPDTNRAIEHLERVVTAGLIRFADDEFNNQVDEETKDLIQVVRDYIELGRIDPLDVLAIDSMGRLLSMMNIWKRTPEEWHAIHRERLRIRQLSVETHLNEESADTVDDVIGRFIELGVITSKTLADVLTVEDVCQMLGHLERGEFITQQ